MINQILAWLADGAHWQGDDGILRRVVEHLEYSVSALLIAALIAIPMGLYIGHTGRGRFLAVSAVGSAPASRGSIRMPVMPPKAWVCAARKSCATSSSPVPCH